jgi:hypothetical protein
LELAMTQQDLGTALWTLGYALWTVGERENGAERLQQATAAYRAALGVLGPGGLLGGPPGGTELRLAVVAWSVAFVWTSERVLPLEQPRQRAPDARRARGRHV